MWRLWRLPEKPWVRVLGTMEAFAAVCCSLFALTFDAWNPGPGMLACALGFGLAVGGLRFGDPLGRIAAELAMVVLSAGVVNVIVSYRWQWSDVIEYWQRFI